MIPDSVKTALQHTLDDTITSMERVSGGSINQAAKVILQNTGPCFLKWNKTADPDMFEKETSGLEMLSGAGTGLLVPGVIACKTSPEGTGFLLLEYFEQGIASEKSHINFGHALAELHKNHKETFGLDHDNYIGRLPQANNPHDNWTDFFIEERLEPQLKMALDSGKLSQGIVSNFETMYRSLPEIFPPEPPALLHGDLWGGNYFYNRDGDAVIYDPAVYYGHREIELAFTHLFGGFSAEFYSAYQDILPLEEHFHQRKDIYNLYPLLVHTNLFGGSYARQVKSIVRRFN